MKNRFLIYKGNILLGEAVNVEPDFPGFIGEFVPAEGFKDFKEYFESEIKLLHENRLEEMDQLRKNILNEELRLEPILGGKQVMNPDLHIEGAEIWWR